MKNERMLRCIGEVDGRYIAEAACVRKTRAALWKKYLPAACLSVVILTALSFGAARFLRMPDAVLENPAAVSGTGLPGAPGEGETLQIPAIVLPEKTEGIQFDMIGLVVYRGSVYTQAQAYQGTEAEAVRALVGDYVGYAKGNIDEWSVQDDYAQELASTYSGEVYTVRGYSEDFRLCMVHEYEDADGNKQMSIQFLERLNGIGVKTGGDLFSDRLHMDENWTSVQYQSHEQWDSGVGEYHALTDVSAAELDRFLEELCAAPFEYVYETNQNFYSDGRAQAHLYFHMLDGTAAELRLFEDGYVGYQNMGWYFVKIPGEAFDAVFDACT